MKRFSIVLSVAVLVLAAVASAFTNHETPAQITYEHFQYTAGVYGETDFENAANWSALGTSNPSSNPCISGSSRICVLRVDQSQLSTDPLLTMPEKLALFLQNQSSADTYVNTAGNYTYQKP